MKESCVESERFTFQEEGTASTKTLGMMNSRETRRSKQRGKLEWEVEHHVRLYDDEH